MGKRQNRFQKALAGLQSSVPGLWDECSRGRFAECLCESDERIRRLRTGRRPWGDPIEIARRKSASDRAEAAWLAFLATHLGWDVPFSTLQVYHGFQEGPFWTWERVTASGECFVKWIGDHGDELATRAPFGNHRKRETHKCSQNGRWTGQAVRGYMAWATENRVSRQPEGLTPEERFDLLYRSVKDTIKTFGRTASYDFVRLLGYLGLADVRPGYCYLKDATGPKDGALLMFGKHLSVPELESRCRELTGSLGVGLDVIEDALCNWQKRRTR